MAVTNRGSLCQQCLSRAVCSVREDCYLSYPALTPVISPAPCLRKKSSSKLPNEKRKQNPSSLWSATALPAPSEQRWSSAGSSHSSVCFNARHVPFVRVQCVSSRMDMEGKRGWYDLRVTLGAVSVLSAVRAGLSSAVKAWRRVYRPLFTLPAGPFLS